MSKDFVFFYEVIITAYSEMSELSSVYNFFLGSMTTNDFWGMNILGVKEDDLLSNSLGC